MAKIEQKITQLPPAPNRFTDNEDSFSLKSENMVDALANSVDEYNTLGNETNAVRDEINGFRNEANQSATTATTKASEASASALNASTSETNALQSETNAKTSEDNAKASELASSTSEANALQSETKAKSSETNAKESELASSTSEANALQSETNAKSSETNAKESEDNAKASELASSTSEVNAKSSEDNAKESESIAIQKASEANQSAIDAKADADRAEDLADFFDVTNLVKKTDIVGEYGDATDKTVSQLRLTEDISSLGNAITNLTDTIANLGSASSQFGCTTKHTIPTLDDGWGAMCWNTVTLNTDTSKIEAKVDEVEFKAKGTYVFTVHLALEKDTNGEVELNFKLKLDGVQAMVVQESIGLKAGTITYMPMTVVLQIDNPATLTVDYKLSNNSLCYLHNFNAILSMSQVGATVDLTGYATESWTNTKLDTKLDKTANAASATKLQTARTIGGVSFDGSANINLPGVNIAGNQNTSGNSGTATKLQTARTINGVAFDGTSNITVSDNTKLPKANPAITGSITEQVYNLTGTAINPANGTIQYKTVSANTTFTESLTSGQSILLRLINASNYTITFPTITWVGATSPKLTANCAIVLWKEQSTLYGAYVGSLV